MSDAETRLTSLLEAMQAQQAQQALQHQQLMETLIAKAASATPAPAPPRAAERTESKSELVPKFITCPQFNVKLEQWEEFQFRLKRAIRSQSSTVQAEMQRV